MKNTIITIVTILSAGVSSVFASNLSVNTRNYKSSDERVSVDIERGNGDVKLHIQLADHNEYAQIFIERSGSESSNFSSCKQISSAQIQADNLQIDKYSSPKDVYYRVRTITKDGVIRAYPAILLAAAK